MLGLKKIKWVVNLTKRKKGIVFNTCAYIKLWQNLTGVVNVRNNSLWCTTAEKYVKDRCFTSLWRSTFLSEQQTPGIWK